MARPNLVSYAFVWEKGKTMDFSETIVVYDLRLATDDRSDKKFLLTSKLCPLGAVCPLSRSYINVFLHKYLCTQLFEAIVKSTKSRFQTANYGIHMLLEHGFYLKILMMGRRLFMWRQTTMQGCPGISILSWFLLMFTSFHFSRNEFKNSENKMVSTDVYSAVKATFSWYFQASLTRVSMESYKM